MNSFLWSVRKAFNSKRIFFLIAFFILISALYFIPFSIVSASREAGFLGFFGSWLGFEFRVYAYQTGLLSRFDFLFYLIFPLILYVIAIISCGLSKIFKPSILALLPFAIFSISRCVSIIKFNAGTTIYNLYSGFYIFIAVFIIASVIIILLASYLPLKEPTARGPRKLRRHKPTARGPRKLRRHKPTKAARISQLERQVAMLERQVVVLFKDKTE